MGVTTGDYDNDGLLDPFVANYVDVSLAALPEFGSGKHCVFRGISVQCGPVVSKAAAIRCTATMATEPSPNPVAGPRTSRRWL